MNGDLNNVPRCFMCGRVLADDVEHARDCPYRERDPDDGYDG